MNPKISGAALILENGMVFTGQSFGAEKTATGEVVFNTGMVGYVESITDPSYAGQVLCQTYPLIGNYGVNSEWYESEKPRIEGYIVHELCEKPSHWASQSSLDAWLASNNVPGICGIDTRRLTKILRVRGVMLGVLATGDFDIEALSKCPIADPNKADLVAAVTTKKVVLHNQEGKGRVVVIDCGIKNSIIKSLVARNLQVVQVPADCSADKIMEFEPAGILISNGPGDPKKAGYVVDTTRKLIEYKLPVFGICLGNQIIALASALDTYKLKFGHRGQNHPCIDLATKRCYITSQNHGYAVKPDENSDLKASFVNANDKSVEGVEHAKLPVFGVQFHPEAAPGPYDTGFLFDKFAKMIGVRLR